MFKLIFFLTGLALAIVFSALNFSNTSDVSFGFKVLTDIPIFFSVAISFLAGSIFTLPFAFYVSRSNKKSKKKTDSAVFVPEQAPDTITPENLD